MLRVTGIYTDFLICKHLFQYHGFQLLNRSSQCKTSSYQEEPYSTLENTQSESTDYEDVKKEVKNSLSSAIDVSSLLKAVTDARGNKATYAFQALNILATWSSDNKVDFGKDVEKDERFPDFVAVLEKFSHKKNILEIINALESLIKIGIKNDSFLIETLENDLLWNVRKVNINQLLKILSFQMNHQETVKQKKVLEATVDTIERRWTDVNYFQDFVTIYEHSKYFRPNFLGHIDDRVVETSENMTMYELSKVFCAVNLSKRRPTPVLRSLSFHMFKKNDKLSPKQTINLIYAMTSLNYSDQALLDKLGTDFLSQIDTVDQPNIIGSLLISMGKMRWRDKLLIEAIGNWILNNIDKCKINDLTNLIITMATISYMPTNISDSFDTILTRINRESIPNISTWVNVVWSLVILEKATTDHIASVLDPSFGNLIAADDPVNVGTHLKILNINAYAKIILEAYEGSLLRVSSLDDLLVTQNRKDQSLQAHVQTVLQNFLPPPKYIRQNIKTMMGFDVDAEIVVDKKKRPVPVVNYSSNFNKEDDKPLPEGAQRIAIMVWNYKDYTIGSQELTGFNPIIVKILEKLGYRVIQVPYFDINEREKIVKSVVYFQRRINEIDDVVD